MKKRLFTSEAVSEGHPDKVCDLIADRIVDACLEQDPSSHVACEVFASDEYVLVGGEITTKAKIDIDFIVRDTLIKIGYVSSEIGIDPKTCKVDIKVRLQSPEINKAVTKKNLLDTGAGDQGIIFGYATSETKNYMPTAICLANDIMKRASKLRKEGKFRYARPDMKCQVTVNYATNTIDTVLISVQHDPDYNEEKFKKYIIEHVINPVIEEYGFDTALIKYLINPSGSFTIGGPKGDTGITGRKLVCDSYGGSSHHGGGAMSGKDPTKVDRSAAYYARYIAKNLIAAGVAKRLEIEIGYAIGVAKPISLSFLTFKTSNYSDEFIEEIINKVFDCRVGAIISQFSLNKPKFKYADTTNYGTFGRDDISLPWEKLDKVNEIKKLLKQEEITSL